MGCSHVVEVPTGTFNYGGSICFAALSREGIRDAIAQAHPQFRLNYVEPKENPECSTGV